jgi:preprotein translocase subunit SecG
MESENTSTEHMEAKPEPKKRSMRLVLIAVVVIAIVVVGVVAYTLLSNPDNGLGGGTQEEWFFKGAYATYEGEATYLTETMTFFMKMEISDLNSTHLKTVVDMEISSATLGTLADQQETSWVAKKDMTSFGLGDIEGYNLDRTYEDNVYIEGFGTKRCKVYEFSSADVGGVDMTMTAYMDPDLGWPLKIAFHMNVIDEEVNFDINLKSTNISALT